MLKICSFLFSESFLVFAFFFPPQDDICQKTLTSFAFADCNGLVNVSEYIMACQEDLCRSKELKNASCICDTFAEYSRQCAHAGGEPLNWRTSKLCRKY